MKKHESTDEAGIKLDGHRPRVRAVRRMVQPASPPTVQPVAPSVADARTEAERKLDRAFANVNPPPRKPLPPPDDAAALVPPGNLEKLKTAGAAAEQPARKKGAAKRPKRQPTGNHTSGYCLPPEHGQIKKGEVRNPRGRPKNARGFNTVVRLTMEEKILLRTARGEKKMTRVEALLLKMVESGFGGKALATQAVQRRDLLAYFPRDCGPGVLGPVADGWAAGIEPQRLDGRLDEEAHLAAGRVVQALADRVARHDHRLDEVRLDAE